MIPLILFLSLIQQDKTGNHTNLIDGFLKKAAYPVPQRNSSAFYYWYQLQGSPRKEGMHLLFFNQKNPKILARNKTIGSFYQSTFQSGSTLLTVDRSGAIQILQGDRQLAHMDLENIQPHDHFIWKWDSLIVGELQNHVLRLKKVSKSGGVIQETQLEINPLQTHYTDHRIYSCLNGNTIEIFIPSSFEFITFNSQLDIVKRDFVVLPGYIREFDNKIAENYVNKVEIYFKKNQHPTPSERKEFVNKIIKVDPASFGRLTNGSFFIAYEIWKIRSFSIENPPTDTYSEVFVLDRHFQIQDRRTMDGFRIIGLFGDRLLGMGQRDPKTGNRSYKAFSW